MKTAYPRVPFPLIVKATDGDVEAINQIVKHYRGVYLKTFITSHDRRIWKFSYGY